jgi:hypothetical protein
VRKPRLTGHIDHPRQAYGGIDDEAHAGRSRPRRAQLQHVVDHHHRLGEVDQDVMDRLADWARREHAVEAPGGPDEIAIQDLLDRKALAIDSLERIARGGGLGVADGKGADRQRHAGGEAPCAHGRLHNSKDSGSRLDRSANQWKQSAVTICRLDLAYCASNL